MARGDVTLPPVGVTGVGVAVLRAVESARPDRLFEDRFAATFVRAAGMADRLEGTTADRRPIAPWVAVRTRFLDEVVHRAGAAGCRQFVILGAGLDTRAFRLPWPAGSRLWELDLPDVLAFKERVVSDEAWRPTCARTTVPIDLSEDWGHLLLGAGLRAGATVAWLAEGLLAYLNPTARDSLLTRAGELSAPGSRMGLTLAGAGRLKAWRDAHPDGRSVPGDFVALWQSDGPTDAVAWLASLGWRAETFDAAERSGAYGRAVAEAVPRSGRPRLVEAVRN